MIFTIIAIVIAAFLLLALGRGNMSSRRNSLPTWHDLAVRLQPVQKENIQILARDFLTPSGPTIARKPEEIWDLVGGVEGLKRMKENADVLLALASYAQIWNQDEGAIVTERMRRDGLALRRAVMGFGVALIFRYSRSRLTGYIYEAATSYYLMRERLLALYKNTHEGSLPPLEELI